MITVIYAMFTFNRRERGEGEGGGGRKRKRDSNMRTGGSHGKGSAG